MKTVRELKELLQHYSDDLLVGIYCDEAEEATMFSRLSMANKGDHPYVKTIDVYEMWDIDETKPILFIR